VKTSTMFTEAEHLIKEIIENISKIRQNRENNSISVKENKQRIENEIQELRTKINNHLDKLQEKLMTELAEAEKQVKEETRELLVSLDEKQNVAMFFNFQHKRRQVLIFRYGYRGMPS
jgi:Skp family chaperone for outer membrane proteins